MSRRGKEIPFGFGARGCVERMAKTWALICAGGKVNTVTLGAEFECSAKTSMRDIEFMRDRLGLPIRYEPRKWSYVTDDSAIKPWWLKGLNA